MNLADFDDTKLWKAPFVTPMIERVFTFITATVKMGGTGGVIYAPTRTGKSQTIIALLPEVISFQGNRGNAIISEAAWVDSYDRIVMSEGGFWEWLLQQFKHDGAGRRLAPLERRRIVYEYVKGLAGKTSSGRLILFIDEAQKLELVELGWVADLFNELQRDGFELVVFLVGSYHLQKWKNDLRGKEHEHVRSRFFARECRLSGLSEHEDFRRCLRRYDVDARPFEGKQSITQYFHPDWFADGGRLEKYAPVFREAFRQESGQRKTFEVPMAYFVRTVRCVLDRKQLNLDFEYLRKIINETGYASENDD